MTERIIITVDGPAAAGKGTIARAIGRAFDLAVLDTGLLYRLVGLDCHRAGIDPHDLATVMARAEEWAARLATDSNHLNNDDLRGRDAGIYASVYSGVPGARAALIGYQRHFAEHPPVFADGHHACGAVLDGRDCGTVICPDAPLKFYITAHVEERAHRRHRDLVGRGDDITYNDVLQDLMARDHRDMTRAVAPTLPADDAVVIDTTGRDVNDILGEVYEWIQRRLGLSTAILEDEIKQHPEELE